MGNISVIKKNKLCMSCGACSSVCPVGAIKMDYMEQEGVYRPSIDENKCVDCGKCISVCPAERQDKISLMGDFRALYLAHATDDNVRHWATSGGVINALVRYLLDTGIVEAVLMTGYCKDSPIEAKPYWLTRDNVSMLTKYPRDFSSRYTIVPVLEKMKEVSKNASIAVVGTSCHMTALKCMVGTNNQNIFKIGITCSGGMSYLATTEFKRLKNAQSAKMFYRGDGWPGKNSLLTDQDCLSENHNGSLFERMFSSQIFKNSGCRYCKDHFAEDAEISFCDFWNKDEMTNEHEGNSCVIVRSDRAYRIIKAMEADNYIQIVRELTETEIESGQLQVLKVKKGDPEKLHSYRLFMKTKEFIFTHRLHRLFGYKVYKLLCRVYNKITQQIRIQ